MTMGGRELMTEVEEITSGEEGQVGEEGQRRCGELPRSPPRLEWWSANRTWKFMTIGGRALMTKVEGIASGEEAQEG